MIVVFPFHSGDVQKANQLINWIKQLGGCKKHKALLVADAGLNWIPVFDLKELAESCFESVDLISNPVPVSGWPAGPNSLFHSAALHISKNETQPWFWCETDCIPLKPGWLDMLGEAYATCGKPYMGAIVPCSQPGLPPQHLNGNAVYPPNAFDVYSKFCNGSKAFDIAAAEEVVLQAANTFRIQHFWGHKDLAPTFALTKTPQSPINTFTLSSIKEGAVVFHRNKDGTLIRCLWSTYYPKTVYADSFILVLPFCNKDCNIALKNVEWMKELNPGGYKCDVLLSYDAKTDAKTTNMIEAVSRTTFRSVKVFKYPAPRVESWPQGPNFAFQSTANYIHFNIKRPWFWMEADMVPLKANWLTALQEEYELCGKPFMGNIVQNLGHMNGAGVYPADFPARCPTAMRVTTEAWDYAMKGEMISECHDASGIMQHLWGMSGGKPHHQLGNAPSFKDRKNLKLVNANAVVLHRCKDGSLIDALKG